MASLQYTNWLRNKWPHLQTCVATSSSFLDSHFLVPSSQYWKEISFISLSLSPSSYGLFLPTHWVPWRDIRGKKERNFTFFRSFLFKKEINPRTIKLIQRKKRDEGPTVGPNFSLFMLTTSSTREKGRQIDLLAEIAEPPPNKWTPRDLYAPTVSSPGKENESLSFII